MSKAESRIAGERSESRAIEELPWLKYVPDETAEHYDAVARHASGPVDEGDRIEIKSVSVVLSSGDPGRFYLRQRQHARLLEEDGWYLFLVCAPHDREILAYELIRASDVPIAGWWTAGPGRSEYRQIRWTDLIDDTELLNE